MNRTRNNTRPARRPFVEDPDKAVFLSGFREDINVSDWRQYREDVYQDIHRDYGVYITKLDLPVNSKYGYLHVKTIKEAKKLLNLKPEINDDVDNDGPVMRLAGGLISVFEYKKTQKRINEEKNHSRFANSGYSTRDMSREESPVRYNNRYTSEENRQGRRDRYDRSHSRYHDDRTDEVRRSVNHRGDKGDSALPTNDVSETEEDCNNRIDRSGSPVNNSLPILNIEQTIVMSPRAESEESETKLEPLDVTKEVNDLIINTSLGSSLSLGAEKVAVAPVEEMLVVSPITNSFDDVTTAFNNSDSLAQVLLKQNWHESFNTWPDENQIYLMIIFMLTFRQEGAHAAVAMITRILKEAEILELQKQNQELILQAILATTSPSA